MLEVFVLKGTQPGNRAARERGKTLSPLPIFPIWEEVEDVTTTKTHGRCLNFVSTPRIVASEMISSGGSEPKRRREGRPVLASSLSALRHEGRIGKEADEARLLISTVSHGRRERDRDRQRGAAIRVKVVHGVLRKITTTDGATCGSNLGAVVCVFGGHAAKSIDNHQPEEGPYRRERNSARTPACFANNNRKKVTEQVNGFFSFFVLHPPCALSLCLSDQHWNKFRSKNKTSRAFYDDHSNNSIDY